MGGDIQLSDMKATYYPPSIQPGFMGAHPPVKNGYGSLADSAHISYFQNYRNENLSKMQAHNKLFIISDTILFKESCFRCPPMNGE